MKDSWKFISNPFYKVAGYKAAGWGILGIVITTVIAYGADVHFHGLRHYKIFCVNGNTGFKFESRIFYFIDLQNEEDYERKESSSAR